MGPRGPNMPCIKINLICMSLLNGLTYTQISLQIKLEFLYHN